MWSARRCSHRQLPRSTIGGEAGEDRREETGLLAILFSGPLVVTVTVYADSLMIIGGRPDGFSCHVAR